MSVEIRIKPVPNYLRECLQERMNGGRVNPGNSPQGNSPQAIFRSFLIPCDGLILLPFIFSYTDPFQFESQDDPSLNLHFFN